MWSINGQEIRPPVSFSITISDLDASGERNAAGNLLRSRISTKRKIDVQFGNLSLEESSVILDATKNEFFQLSYPDPWKGQNTITVYVGDRSATLKSYYKNQAVWSQLKFNLIER